MVRQFWIWLVGLSLAASCGGGTDGIVSGSTGGFAGSTTVDSGGAAGNVELPGAAGHPEVPGGAGAPNERCECTSPLHCESRVCTDSGFCEPTRCFDGVLNGSETDVDCGGPGCAPCPRAAGCVSGGDCANGSCRCGQCMAGGAPGDAPDVACEPPRGCADGIQNLDESDVDCGGSCERCASGQSCETDEDCESDSCRYLIARPLVCGDVKACE